MATFDLIEVDCPLCGNSRREVLFQTFDFVQHATEQAFTLCRCRVCGVGYLSPRPRAEDMHAFYLESYYWIHENVSAPLTPDELLRNRAAPTPGQVGLFGAPPSWSSPGYWSSEG